MGMMGVGERYTYLLRGGCERSSGKDKQCLRQIGFRKTVHREEEVLEITLKRSVLKDPDSPLYVRIMLLCV